MDWKNINLYLGDCKQVMKTFPSDSIDTLLCDPPYGLSFMGKKWDYEVPSIELWKECLRVLKPGGTALIFAGSRTQHRMACNIEDAGFILKDCIMWLYGSGFPKAYDIAKGIEGKKKYGSANWKDWNKLDGDLVDSKIGYSKLQADQGYRDKDYSDKKHLENVKLHTEEAKLWNGWKSHGLKPAYEPILVAMKPNEGSYAENALKHGVAGLNIDGGRIEGKPRLTGTLNKGEEIKAMPTSFKGSGTRKLQTSYDEDMKASNKGRFPANIILDEEAAKILDEQSEMNVSRFFYTAKASKKERNKGCEDLETSEKFVAGNYSQSPTCKDCNLTLNGTNDHSKCSGEVYYKEMESKNTKNHHPTVKPLKLMEYLCILTKTPTGGVVLDPFMGSGTTGIACKMTNRKFIGIEMKEEYMKIAVARIKAYKKED